MTQHTAVNRRPGPHVPAHDELRIEGYLDQHWSTWFGGLTLTREDDGTTTLRGAVTDQAECTARQGARPRRHLDLRQDDRRSRSTAWRMSRTECGVARTMHSGLIGSAHTLSPWTPPGLNGCAVSARAPTWPLVAHHPQLKDRLSVPDQRMRRRQLETVESDRATADAGPLSPRAFWSLRW